MGELGPGWGAEDEQLEGWKLAWLAGECRVGEELRCFSGSPGRLVTIEVARCRMLMS